ncbi:MAG: ThiF family adenylyltransferase [Steroidobacteraceae bacterium]
MSRFSFSTEPLNVPALQSSLVDVRCGGYAAFEGWVRNHNEGREVTGLEYEAFTELAVREGERIIAEACAKFGVDNARCVHRIGALELTDIAVWVGVSARHRDEAFRACRYIIDEVKHRVPIWKKEHYVTGDTGWVNCERCATAPAHTLEAHAHDHGHTHDHGHAHDHAHAHHHAAAPSVQPDYSRQIRLREVGAAGQARLRASTVGVVGAGGLGVPVLQYLAGAGVGTLVIIDGDRLEASNLHRQTWYSLADCGTHKAALAAARVTALNPEVAVRAETQRLDAMNATQLLAGCDVLVDCTDNFASKFLLNDIAHSLGVPLVLASVHQFEGQLQIVDPARGSACLRCIWPQATQEGVVANCAEAGVLGPVPGVLGSLQALEVLKILLGLPGRLANELLIVNLLDLTTTRVKARRAAECAGACSRAAAGLAAARANSALEVDFETLDSALAAGFHVIDIREAHERDSAPLPGTRITHIPMQELLEGRNLPADGQYLLVCARGARSLNTTRTLRARGLHQTYSLRGGAERLRRQITA